jgi:hypothetical protein
MSTEEEMVDVHLGRIVIQDGLTHQFIYINDPAAGRGFPIVIGNNEADEIHRVVHKDSPPRPLTHQLCYSAIQALGAEIKRIDIVDLRDNTYFAQLVLQDKGGNVTAVIDARPSDAIALALRAGCPLRVAKHVLDLACNEGNGKTEP